MDRLYRQFTSTLPHMTAASVALLYAWWLSETALFDTGLQFVSPFAIIIGVHLIWFAAQGRLQRGFANRLYSKALGTAVFMFAMLILGSLFAPQPAYAAGDEISGIILVLVFCAAVIAAVVWLLAIVIKLLFFGLEKIIVAVTSNGNDDPPQNRLFDIGSLTVCLALIVGASLEGMPKTYRFDTDGSVGSTVQISAPADVVWQTMQTATSPAFSLPAALGFFPQPVAVPVDEGVAPGANRVVAFAGREGSGALHLRVRTATETTVVFDVISDTTPYAGWIGFRQLTYDVRPGATGTDLTTTLVFDRKLAPAWFFGPVMKGASYLAMDVLARDVKARSEAEE